MTGLVASGLTDFLRAAVDPQVQVDAIGIGAVYALMAVGIGLVFGVLRLVNFAYGQLVMVLSMHPHAIAANGEDCLYMQDTWLVTAEGGVPLAGLPMEIVRA